MDEGPFRMPKPADRSAAPEPEPAHRRPEEPRTIREEPRPVHRTTAHRATDDEKPWKRFVLPIVALVVIAVLCVGGWFMWSGSQNTGTAIDSGKYQAVFFTNGQVYFGKLQAFNNEYMKLTDIFYLQTQTSSTETDSKNPQKTATDQNNPTLIKLGDEIHGPEDEMIISKDQMLFYENLKSDGKVAKSIEKYKSSNGQ